MPSRSEESEGVARVELGRQSHKAELAGEFALHAIDREDGQFAVPSTLDS